MAAQDIAIFGYDVTKYPILISRNDFECVCCRIQMGHTREAIVCDKASKHEFQLLAPDLVRSIPSSAPDLLGVNAEELQSNSQFIDSYRKLKSIPSIEREISEIENLFDVYDQACRGEFETIKESLKPSFKMKEDRFPEVWQYYQWVRPFYFKFGITRPVPIINEIDTNVRFLGKLVTGGAAPALKKVLLDAESCLASMGPSVKATVIANVGRVAGFVPRPLNDNSRLSLHALGLAIDIDAALNPDLKGRQAEAIDRVLTWLESKGQIGSERIQKAIRLPSDLMDEDRAYAAYVNIRTISDAMQSFLQKWLELWLQAQTRSLTPEEMELTKESFLVLEEFILESGVLTKARSGGVLLDQKGNVVINKKSLAKVKKIRDIGLISIPLELVVALAHAKAKPGVEYTSSKDVMHFDAPVSFELKTRVNPPSCLERCGFGKSKKKKW